MECAMCGQDITGDAKMEMKSGETWCQSCYYSLFHRCDKCKKEILLSEVVPVQTKPLPDSSWNGIFNTCHDCVEKVKAEHGVV